MRSFHHPHPSVVRHLLRVEDLDHSLHNLRSLPVAVAAVVVGIQGHRHNSHNLAGKPSVPYTQAPLPDHQCTHPVPRIELAGEHYILVEGYHPLSKMTDKVESCPSLVAENEKAGTGRHRNAKKEDVRHRPHCPHESC